MPPGARDDAASGGQLDNAALAERLEAFAALLELEGSSFYAARAFRRAAETVRGTDASVAELALSGRVGELRGIGPGHRRASARARGNRSARRARRARAHRAARAGGARSPSRGRSQADAGDRRRSRREHGGRVPRCCARRTAADGAGHRAEDGGTTPRRPGAPQRATPPRRAAQSCPDAARGDRGRARRLGRGRSAPVGGRVLRAPRSRRGSRPRSRRGRVRAPAVGRHARRASGRASRRPHGRRRPCRARGVPAGLLRHGAAASDGDCRLRRGARAAPRTSRGTRGVRGAGPGLVPTGAPRGPVLGDAARARVAVRDPRRPPLPHDLVGRKGVRPRDGVGST